MQRLCWLLTMVFVLTTAALVCMFVIRGETLPASDGRKAVLLAPGERDLVLAEMRAFLVALQEISQAVVEQDAAMAAAAAQQGMPAGLAGKLPLEFKRLGFDTHSRFDQLALNAEQFGDSAQVLPELATLMQNCIACHAVYRFDLEQP